jgi:hypothetical protein
MLFIDTHNIKYWISQYVFQELSRAFDSFQSQVPIHIVFSLTDHFEPYWNGVDQAIARERVRSWTDRYPPIALQHCDSDGCYPRHTFFYPIEEYDPTILDSLSGLCHDGFGEVEIHLHHDNDTGENLRTTLLGFKDLLRSRHSLLSYDKINNETMYGFIHGNWALDNSRPDGRWCGVNNEITVLLETGCYADFTLPSAPSPTQTRKINSIYYAIDNQYSPKSHDWGVDAKVGRQVPEGLLLIQGPLGLNFNTRTHCGFPRIENGDLCHDNPPNAVRIRLWIQRAIHVKGRNDVVFVKVYTHGAQEKNMSMLLDNGLNLLYSQLEEHWNDGNTFQLHYVSTREMFNIIRAIEKGETGSPGLYRNYFLTR